MAPGAGKAARGKRTGVVAVMRAGWYVNPVTMGVVALVLNVGELIFVGLAGRLPTDSTAARSLCADFALKSDLSAALLRVA